MHKNEIKKKIEALNTLLDGTNLMVVFERNEYRVIRFDPRGDFEVHNDPNPQHVIAFIQGWRSCLIHVLGRPLGNEPQGK